MNPIEKEPNTIQEYIDFCHTKQNNPPEAEVLEIIRRSHSLGKEEERKRIIHIAKDMHSMEQGAQARGWNDALQELVFDVAIESGRDV